MTLDRHTQCMCTTYGRATVMKVLAEAERDLRRVQAEHDGTNRAARYQRARARLTDAEQEAVRVLEADGPSLSMDVSGNEGQSSATRSCPLRIPPRKE
jgi:hypothetical protein